MALLPIYDTSDSTKIYYITIHYVISFLPAQIISTAAVHHMHPPAKYWNGSISLYLELHFILITSLITDYSQGAEATNYMLVKLVILDEASKLTTAFACISFS